MFRSTALVTLLLATVQVHAASVNAGAVFSAVVSDDQALVGFYVDAKSNIANYALCDFDGQTLSACQLQSEGGFVASADNMDHLRVQFEHNVSDAYRLVQLGALPSVTANYEGVKNAIANSDKTPQELGTEVMNKLDQSGALTKQATLSLSANEQAQLMTLTPAKIESRQMSLLNPDEAPGLDLETVASSLKISLQLMQ